MSWPLIVALALSVAFVAVGYWRASILHSRIREIDPKCPWQRTDFVSRRKSRKD